MTTRASRLACAVAACAVLAAFSYVAIWACYGFRYEPTPDPAVRLNTTEFTLLAKAHRWGAHHPDGRPLTRPELEALPTPAVARVVQFGQRHRLLPQAWLSGFLYTYATTQERDAFLQGRYSVTGWWSYFPRAMLFKTPLATLLAATGAMLALVVLAFNGRFRPPFLSAPGRPTLDGWSIVCLALPVAVYGIFALTSNINIGLRHVLPVYPFLYIAIGLGMARLVRRCRKAGPWVAAALALGLAAETLPAYPDYVAFFNTAAGGPTGGLQLLSDSNLDWGQDLKLLAAWQHRHPDTKLYLCYFGLADPAAYGIRFTNLPGSRAPSAATEFPSTPGVLAISATNLQGTYFRDPWRAHYRAISQTEPVDVLGGTIYLYQWPHEDPVQE